MKDIFDNDNIETSNSLDRPSTWCRALVFGYDKGLRKDIYLLAYYREDTKKFYMDVDCLKEKDLESFWMITIKKWAVVNFLEKEDFTE